MKLLYRVFTLLSAFFLCGSAHAENWVMLGQPDQLINVYADKNSTKRAGDIGKIRIRTRVSGAGDSLGVWEFDCKQRVILSNDGVSRNSSSSAEWEQAMQMACKSKW